MSGNRILFVYPRMGRIFALGLLLALCAVRASAQQDQSAWHVLIEPDHMFPEVSFPISGARHTVLVPGYMEEGDPQYFTKKQWDAAGLTWDAFRARAAQNATQKKFDVQLIRDEKKVVEYALINSDDPLTGTMVLAPDFLKKFGNIFGPKILVAIPNRFTVFIFPSEASQYQDYATEVMSAYYDSAYPVSLEVFEISSAGIRAIGTYSDE
jgi:hypothetical protein